MSLWHDLRFGVRLLVKGRWFTLAAIVALALGIGANVTIFTIVNAVLLADIPFDKPEQIVAFSTKDAQGRQNGVSFPDFQDWKASAHSFSSMAFVNFSPFSVSEQDRAPEQYLGPYVSIEIFRMLNQHAIIGRDFRAEDDRPGAPPVLMLANTMWKKRYGGDQNVIGKVVRLNGLSATIIGVMPEVMQFPFNAELWLPEAQWLQGVPERNRSVHNYIVFGRLADGVPLKQAQAEMATIGAKLQRDYPKEDKGLTPFVDRVGARACGNRHRFRDPPHLRGAAPHRHGHRGARAADRLRECGEPAAGASRRSRQGDRDPLLGRRHAPAGDPAAARRKRAARLHRRPCRPWLVDLWAQGVRRGDAECGQAVLDGVHAQRARVHVLRPRVRGHRHHVRSCAGAAHLEDEPERRVERRRPHRIVGIPRAAMDRRAHHCRAGAHARPARRRRLHDAQFSDLVSN